MLTEAQKLQKQKELEKAQKDVMESIEKATNSPEDMKELLNFLSKYSNYSIKNRILLHRQGAKAVKSYKGWQDAGYQVQKGEKALKIWTPVVIKSFVSNGKKKSLKYATKQEKTLIAQGVLQVSTWVTFNLRACVFDALQTDMPNDELPKLYANKHIDREIDTQKAQEVISSVENVINRLGVALENPTLEEWNGGFAKGYYVPSSRKIVMNPKNTDYEKINVLIHETAHAILHSKNENKVSKELGLKLDENSYEIGELQAEMTAYLTTKSLGMESEEDSVSYMAGWTKNGSKFQEMGYENQEKVLDDVVKVSDYILEEIVK